MKLTNEIPFSPGLKLIFLVLVGFILSNTVQLLFIRTGWIVQGQEIGAPQFYLAAICSQVFIFLLPSIVWLNWMQIPVLYSGRWLRKSWLSFAYVVSLIVVIYACNNVLSKIVESIEQLSWMYDVQQQQAHLYKRIFNGENSFFIAILLIAILPALVEELFFRRVLFGYFSSNNQVFWKPAIISSLIFAIVHFQPMIFPALFTFAMLFSYLYWVSGSIWLGAILHASNNAFQILLIYYQWKIDDWTLYTVGGVFALIALGLFYLLKPQKNKKL